jgi:hypothetical protein
MRHLIKIFFVLVLFINFINLSNSLAYEVGFPNIPGTPNPYESPANFVYYLFVFALAVGGILAFGSIVIAGIEWTISAGNPSLQEDAKDRIRNAVFGLILLLASYVILYTINPQLVRLKNPTIESLPNLPPPPSTGTGTPGGGGGGGGGSPPGGGSPSYCGSNQITPDMCSNPQALAAACNAAFPYGNHPNTISLINCVKDEFKKPQSQGGFGREFGGSIYTYEVSNPLCNYTKGRPVCGRCAHTINSCHYGGSPSNPEGNKGALAIDWGFGWLRDYEKPYAGAVLDQAARTCGAKGGFCDKGGERVNCLYADHYHMTVRGCDGF